MRVGDDESFVDFHFNHKESVPSSRAGDVACSVKARSDGFSGVVASVWFSREDVSEFLAQLDQLEKTRKGLARLSNLSSASEYNPLVFEIVAIDEAGHLAVKAELAKISYSLIGLTPSKVSIIFPLDGEQLDSVLIGFRKLFA